MELVTQTPLRAAQLVWRPAHGGFVLTVVCRATFALRPGQSPLAPTQQPVATADVYAEGSRALQTASDMVPLKKQPEVLLTGHAFAPGGQRATSCVARLAVGEIDKAVQVTGDRAFGLDGALSDPAPFVRLPLVWDRAAGGPDTSNPVGRPIGTAATPDAYGRVPAPNLLPAGFHLTSRNDIVPVVGLGPIAPHWPSRAGCLHRYAAGWDPARWHERPLPPDIDLAYFSAAPPDQRRSAPFGDEQLYLENLHPLFAQLQTRLAPITPSVIVERGQGSEPLQLRCDTLVLDTDRGLAMLVWRGHVQLDHPDRPGRILVTHTEAREASASSRPAALPVFDQTQAADISVPPAGSLPFSPAAAGSAEPSPASKPTSVAPPAAGPTSAPAAANPLTSGETLAVDALFGGTMAFGFASAAPAVPFPQSPTGSAPPRDPAPAENNAGLPFSSNPQPASDTGSPPAASFDPVAAAATAPFPTFPEPASPAPPPPLPLSPAPLSPALAASVPFSPVLPDPPTPSGELALPPSPVTDSPAPPPFLGPAPAPAEAPNAPTTDPEAYPPARCGAIAARLECNESAAPEILRSEGLDADRWERVHEHWQGHMDAEAARGRTGPLADHDRGYVTTLESERLPITVDVYARLAEANERGALDDVLADLRFPEDAWLPIQRVWIAKLLADPKLAQQVRAAMAGCRGSRA
jgi:hypothetical protein